MVDAGTATAVQMSPSGPHSSARTSTYRPRQQNARRLRSIGWVFTLLGSAASAQRAAASEAAAARLLAMQNNGPRMGQQRCKVPW